MYKNSCFSVSGLVIMTLCLVANIAFASGQNKLDAGPDATVSVGESVTLRGSVNDPEPPYITIGWSRTEGPGEVEFSYKHSATPDVTFSEPGRYVLRLGGYDGDIAYDDVVVTVTP